MLRTLAALPLGQQSAVLKGCRLRGKDGDSSCETAMPGRENIPGSVAVAVVYRAAPAASPLSYTNPKLS